MEENTDANELFGDLDVGLELAEDDLDVLREVLLWFWERRISDCYFEERRDATVDVCAPGNAKSLAQPSSSRLNTRGGKLGKAVDGSLEGRWGRHGLCVVGPGRARPSRSSAVDKTQTIVPSWS